MAAFKALQTRKPEKKMVQDVKTCWKSTFQMLLQALRLREVVSDWIEQDGTPPEIAGLAIQEEEWEQIEALMHLLKPYYTWTEALSKTTGVAVNYAWSCYHALHNHLDEVKTNLSTDRVLFQGWRRELAGAVEAARAKLAGYYSRTTDGGRRIFNLACILDPRQKLEPWHSSDSWEDDYRSQYENEFRDEYGRVYRHYEQHQPPVTEQLLAGNLQDLNYLGRICQREMKRKQAASSHLDYYLRNGPTNDSSPLAFWRSEEDTIPGLAQMAQDVLAVPLSDAGVKRIF